ncbi:MULTISPECIES: universal stress protein [unclassified Fusibacter]|uniref:universal stress protein n=1 Tax=unclassified Fusibacter TaxID=2624464 RepID=UPI0010106AF2|nr:MULTISPECIES: universal stress protein [unclassified Fusibacter]MCK8058307.1 universal stress protein [Fusibacter sp. A2]NPE20890.1 universal stress protein [Fusibacter sp. A1]RXV63094.1 universal stress protein [Fusibacter sp. A1]
MFTKILVPIDGTITCQKSIDYVKNIASKFQSEVILFNAQDIAPSIAWVNDPVAYNQPQIDPEKIAQEILAHASNYFTDVPFKVTTEFSIGDPAHAILEAADEYECDAIIMCTHGMKAFKRFLLGSVTNKVVHHAKVTVLIVR